MSLYVPLSTEWADHPKLIRAGLAGRGLHALTLAIAKRLETDGWVDRLLLHREGADDDLIDRLVDLRLLDVDEAHPDAARPHNWHRHNPTQASIDAGRAAKAEAGKRGNHTRHKHGGTFEDCTVCHPKPQVVAGCETGAIANARKASPKTEAETKTIPLPVVGDHQHAPTDPDRPVDEQTRLRAVALVAKVEAGDRASDGAWCGGIRREILTGPDPDRLRRIDTELAAGRSPEDIAAAWSTADPLTGLLAGPRPADVTARPVPPEYVPLGPPPPTDHRAGIAAARAAREATTP